MRRGLFNVLYFSNCPSPICFSFFCFFFLPFFSTGWLIDLFPPPFLILHLYLFLFSFLLFTSILLLLLFQCLLVSSGIPSSLFLYFDEPSSLFNSLYSSQNSSSASFLVSLTETIMVVFFVKNTCRALHRHRAVAAPFFAWNYIEHWCEFNVWQNLMVEASTIVIWCCESIIFLFLVLIKIALTWTMKIVHSFQTWAVQPRFERFLAPLT